MRQWGEFTDFYSSEHHAQNVGKMFRDPDNALLPNWKHLPVGYHGRSSSLIASGEPVWRPSGQRKEADGSITFGPTRKLDFELEVGVVISRDSERGRPITMAEADSYIKGLVLVNDWSARDIQAWEYVPLGPFLGKNFATTVGDTVVPLSALEPVRVEGPAQDPTPLPYLQRVGPSHFDITLEAWHETPEGVRTLLTHTNHRHLYWDIRQQLVHHTSNGCNVRAGDILASGTISGPERESWGCLLELSWNGSKPLTLEDGTQRTFLEDGDTVELRGWAGDDPSVDLGVIRNPVVAGRGA
ncbi:MAG: fumarylacetoacetase [Crocinitomicaceae bacterium TMED114]|nr:MAG: fumarylacetoacetase [Crocinitomicaceae bacterium TMED114]